MDSPMTADKIDVIFGELTAEEQYRSKIPMINNFNLFPVKSGRD
jgi:hypothetical protein